MAVLNGIEFEQVLVGRASTVRNPSRVYMTKQTRNGASTYVKLNISSDVCEAAKFKSGDRVNVLYSKETGVFAIVKNNSGMYCLRTLSKGGKALAIVGVDLCHYIRAAYRTGNDEPPVEFKVSYVEDGNIIFGV